MPDLRQQIFVLMIVFATVSELGCRVIQPVHLHKRQAVETSNSTSGNEPTTTGPSETTQSPSAQSPNVVDNAAGTTNAAITTVETSVASAVQSADSPVSRVQPAGTVEGNQTVNSPNLGVASETQTESTASVGPIETTILPAETTFGIDTTSPVFDTPTAALDTTPTESPEATEETSAPPVTEAPEVEETEAPTLAGITDPPEMEETEPTPATEPPVTETPEAEETEPPTVAESAAEGATQDPPNPTVALKADAQAAIADHSAKGKVQPRSVSRVDSEQAEAEEPEAAG